MIFVENNFYMDGGDFNQLVPISNYEARGVFSLDSQRKLQGTFWVIKNGELVTSSLGSASYKIYDKDGNEVSGLSETGLTPNINGKYMTTPVNASVLSDLTHYVAFIAIDYEGETRENYIGIIVGY